jgi:UDP-3-O-[3-hydroxymyristoyl] glucosamine N-acyltransferase
MAFTLEEIAARFGGDIVGDRTHRVSNLAPLDQAGPEHLAFLANPKYLSQVDTTQAGAVLINADDLAKLASPDGRNFIVTPNPYAYFARVAQAFIDLAAPKAVPGVHPRPYLTYARIATRLHPPPAAVAGVHPSAVIAQSAQVAPTAEVGPQAVVGPGCRIGDAAVIGPGSVLGKDVSIGARTRLVARVTVLDGVRIGARCILHPGSVIGADGFGFAPDGGQWLHIPQLGSVTIGDDVEIGANTTVDRGTIDDTVIENGVKLDNLVQIAHNVRVGEHTVMAAMSGAAGSTRIGKRCMIGGGVVMINQIEICDDVLLLFRSVVTKSIEVPGTYSGSLPAEEASKWRRNAARFRKLDSLATRLAEAERALAAVVDRIGVDKTSVDVKPPGNTQKKRDD